LKFQRSLLKRISVSFRFISFFHVRLYSFRHLSARRLIKCSRSVGECASTKILMLPATHHDSVVSQAHHRSLPDDAPVFVYLEPWGITRKICGIFSKVSRSIERRISFTQGRRISRSNRTSNQ
jgi:hypothetical protein